MLQTPPLPLPLKGGECLTESLPLMTAQLSPPFKGRGRGGVSNLIIPSYCLTITIFVLFEFFDVEKNYSSSL